MNKKSNELIINKENLKNRNRESSKKKKKNLFCKNSFIKIIFTQIFIKNLKFNLFLFFLFFIPQIVKIIIYSQILINININIREIKDEDFLMFKGVIISIFSTININDSYHVFMKEKIWFKFYIKKFNNTYIEILILLNEIIKLTLEKKGNVQFDEIYKSVGTAYFENIKSFEKANCIKTFSLIYEQFANYSSLIKDCSTYTYLDTAENIIMENNIESLDLKIDYLFELTLKNENNPKLIDCIDNLRQKIINLKNDINYNHYFITNSLNMIIEECYKI